ncbi:MAG: DUF456 domain-containing protein [Alistipes putredinis]|nr:MAG: DUF456 domain-containing protein [Alistipes putredinis]
MDVFLSIAAVVLALAGLAGCILPAIPGPPISYAALLVVSAASYSDMSWRFLVVWLVIMAAVTAADYCLPAAMTRRFGGSKSATWGAMLGTVAGFFVFPPWGNNNMSVPRSVYRRNMDRPQRREQAFRVATGAFLAFVFGTGAKTDCMRVDALLYDSRNGDLEINNIIYRTL